MVCPSLPILMHLRASSLFTSSSSSSSIGTSKGEPPSPGWKKSESSLWGCCSSRPSKSESSVRCKLSFLLASSRALIRSCCFSYFLNWWKLLFSINCSALVWRRLIGPYLELPEAYSWFTDMVMCEALVIMADASVCNLIKFVGFFGELFVGAGEAKSSACYAPSKSVKSLPSFAPSTFKMFRLYIC